MKITGYKGIYVLTETKNGKMFVLASCNNRALLEEVKAELQQKADRKDDRTSHYTVSCPSISL